MRRHLSTPVVKVTKHTRRITPAHPLILSCSSAEALLFTVRGHRPVDHLLFVAACAARPNCVNPLTGEREADKLPLRTLGPERAGDSETRPFCPGRSPQPIQPRSALGAQHGALRHHPRLESRRQAQYPLKCCRLQRRRIACAEDGSLRFAMAAPSLR